MPDGQDGQNVAPAAPSTSAAGGGKKNNSTTIIIIVVAALVVLGVGGYLISRWLAQRAAEKTASALLSAGTGSNANVSDNGNSVSVSNGEGSAQIGESAKWPSDMPSSVPELTAGKIGLASSDKANKSWAVTASNINQSDFDAYKAKILAAGWTSTGTVSSGASYEEYENASYTLTLVFDSSASTLSISVTTKS